MIQSTINATTVDNHTANLINNNNCNLLIGYAIDYLSAFIPMVDVLDMRIVNIISLVNSDSHLARFNQYLLELDRI